MYLYQCGCELLEVNLIVCLFVCLFAPPPDVVVNVFRFFCYFFIVRFNRDFVDDLLDVV